MYSRMPNMQPPLMENVRYPRDESQYRLPPVTVPSVPHLQHPIVPQPVSLHQVIPTYDEPKSVVSRFLDEVSNNEVEPQQTLQAHSMPQQTHHTQQQSHPGPQQNHHPAPQQTHSAPQQSHPTPQQNHPTPQPTPQPTPPPKQTATEEQIQIARAQIGLLNSPPVDGCEQGPLPPTDGHFDEFVEERLDSGCGCSMNCFSKFPFQAIYDHILDVREMGKYEKDLYIMGALSELEVNDLEETTKGTPRQQIRHNYMHCGEKICRSTFLMLYDIGDQRLRNIKKHVATTGISPRIHKNLGKSLKKDNDLGNKSKKKRKAPDTNQSSDVQIDNQQHQPIKMPKLANNPPQVQPIMPAPMPVPSTSTAPLLSPIASTSGLKMLGGKTDSVIDQQVSQALDEIERMENEGIVGPITDPNSVMPEESELEEIHFKVLEGCGCKMDCLRRFPSSVIYDHILDLREMSRTEKDIYVLVALAQEQEEFEEFTKKGTPRLLVNHTFWHMDTKVCRSTFMLVYDIGKNRLESLQRHLVEKGIVPRVHASKGKKPWHAVSSDDVKRVVNFIKNYTEVVGTPQPGAPKVGPEKQTLVMLPMGTRKKDTWKRYSERCGELCVRALKYSTFITIWKNVLPHIKCPEPEKGPHAKKSTNLLC